LYFFSSLCVCVSVNAIIPALVIHHSGRKFPVIISIRHPAGRVYLYMSILYFVISVYILKNNMYSMKVFTMTDNSVFRNNIDITIAHINAIPAANNSIILICCNQ